MKRKLFLGALVTVCVSLLAYSTIAYFSDEKAAYNVITSGDVSIELLEWADKDNNIPYPEETLHGIMPGTTVDKLVEVTNTGSNLAWIRVSVDKTIDLAEASTEEPDLGLMKLDFDKTAWQLKDDGFYYYKDALQPGETSKALFASVTFDIKMDNMYQNSKAKIDVRAQATQVANNGKTATDALGWPRD